MHDDQSALRKSIAPTRAAIWLFQVARIGVQYQQTLVIHRGYILENPVVGETADNKAKGLWEKRGLGSGLNPPHL